MSDLKDGDEVHMVDLGYALMVSHKAYESIAKKIPDGDQEKIGELYGVKVIQTPHLPYIYHELKEEMR